MKSGISGSDCIIVGGDDVVIASAYCAAHLNCEQNSKNQVREKQRNRARQGEKNKKNIRAMEIEK